MHRQAPSEAMQIMMLIRTLFKAILQSSGFHHVSVNEKMQALKAVCGPAKAINLGIFVNKVIEKLT